MKPPFKVECHYRMKFKDNTPDDEWLSIVGTKGWAVLSHDARFHRDSSALEAIKQFKIACFYIWGGQVPIWDKVRVLTATYPKIKHVVNSERPPYIYRANQKARLYLVRHWDGRKEPKHHVRAEPKI